MTPADLRARIAEIARPLESFDVTHELSSALREKLAATLDAVAAEAEREIAPAARSTEDPETRDEAARLYRRLAQSNSWLDGRDARTREWIDRAAELASSDVLRDLITSEQNRLRDPEAFAGIRELCQQGRVDKARRSLKARRRATTDPVTAKRIDEFLSDPRHFLAPLKSAPSMVTYNGVGTMLYGSRNRAADGTHVATLCLVVLFIPILPLRAYLVRPHGNAWTFYGRVPLSPFAFWWRRLLLAGPLLAGLALWGIEEWNSSPYIRETRQLAEASTALERRDYAWALRALGGMAGTHDAGRAARMDDLARRALAQSLGDVRNAADASLFVRTIGPLARSRGAWSEGEVARAAESALDRISSDPGAGRAAREFLEWMGPLSPATSSRMPALALRACERCDHASLLAGAVEIFRRTGVPCPPAILEGLAAHLRRERHEGWEADALTYLRVADPAQAGPILLARAEAAWKGESLGRELLELRTLPPPLATLLKLDLRPDLEARAAALEKEADPAGLDEPAKTWHRLGVARRLANAYGALNEKDPLRFPLSKVKPWAVQAAELAPEDAGLRTAAMRILIQDGEHAHAIKLGTRHQGEPRTALLLGLAYARSGDLEEAARLLRPLVERDLPQFAQAVTAWEKLVASRTEAAWRSLQSGTADRSFIARLNRLPRDRASVEAEQWVKQQVERDPGVVSLAVAWKAKTDVHPAASELAMVELALGRSLPAGPARQARLEAAEHLFLELRKVLHDDPHQDLGLAQVYFWLGKEKEGAEIFQRLEASADAHLLHQMGEIDRALSRRDEARRLLEKAYDQAGGEDKKGIAQTRALTSRGLEDKLVWLRRCDASNPRIRADLDQSEGEAALQKGEYTGAVAPLERAAAYYASLPESPTVTNNAAILQMGLATATGDFKHQMEALRMLRRSHELEPEGGIILGNYVEQLHAVGVAALAGSALRSDLLHEMPNWSWLDYVVPQPSQEQWAQKARGQPELRQAAELAAREVVLSPGRDEGYQVQARYFTLLGDQAMYRRLRESAALNPAARTEEAELVRAHARGEYTEDERRYAERWLARCDAVLPPIRQSGHAPTLAYALIERARARVSALRLGVAKGTLDGAAGDAEEALRVFDAEPTRSMMGWIRSEQAVVAAASLEPELQRWVKENPSVSAAMLLPLYLRRHPDRALEVRSRPEVRRAVDALADLERFSRVTPRLWAWAWLDFSGHPSREAYLKQIRSNPTFLESHRLEGVLKPCSAEEQAAAWLAAMACDERELADKVAQEARTAKLCPLFFGE